MYDMALIRKYDLDDKIFRITENEDLESFSLSSTFLSDFKQAIIPYIAGSAARMTSKACVYETCSDALGSKYHVSTSLFIDKKDHGGLFKRTMSVVKICEQT